MSRIGKLAIPLPQGISVQIADKAVTVKGPKGQLTTPVMPGITVSMQDNALQVQRDGDNKQARAYHGLCRALLNNAVIGVTKGFTKELEIQGVGYRAAVKGADVEFALGYSHPILFPIPTGISISVEKNTEVRVEGIDKQQVGQVAAEIRELRPPEVYKGKGIRYKGEVVHLKEGKAATGK